MTVPTHLTYSEEELIQLLKSKSPIGMSILYDRFSPALFGVASKIVHSDQVAEDVLQEAFVKIWQNSENYDSEKGRVFTWLINITRNLALDKLKSRQYKNSIKNSNDENIVGVIDAHQNVRDNPDTIGVKDLLNHLKPDQKELLDMMYFQGYTQSEISEKLDMPLGSVKTKVRAAISHLRTFFEIR